ncbi:DUF1826 domain-containing protein [Oceanospirillum sediminis]|uniref:DUF1826 domain-containing protein n=1 Tax=Oceanospirillum sediminis TaxID=2760088 RepID=A0A839IL46_9GAMM|nr:DUF1826 domain-containing protein [Oceanospirillum sediminis]MBB1485935.1 DUF1826 domain-containing protein [Oceanospirillum sediminis]
MKESHGNQPEFVANPVLFEESSHSGADLSDILVDKMPCTVVSKQQEWVSDDDPVVLTRIFEQDISLVQWNRQPDAGTMIYVNWLLNRGRLLPLRLVASPELLQEQLKDDLPDHPHRDAFINDMIWLAEMFACLFGMEEVGLRLSLLKDAMCPRFHVDRIGARMVCTYAGAGTEWLSSANLNRSRLGAGSGGLSDEDSGLYINTGEAGVTEKSDIHAVPAGAVALMKGDLWPDREGQGLVHRSPACSETRPRLFLSMDVL